MTADPVRPTAEWLAQAVLGNYAERPRADALTRHRVWSYTDAQSYLPGDRVKLELPGVAQSTWKFQTWRRSLLE